MSQLMRFTVDHEPVLFEVRLPGEDVVATAVSDRVIEATDKSLDAVFGLVRRIASSFSTALTGAPVAASEVEFGLDLTAEGDLYVVSASGTATLNVKMSFNSPRH